ncbi:MAG TPA: type II toxin-antitoxin system Phd/YefM family antitoxin [Rubrobacteraceae bacterium]|nr:type II toxin-antitoxin system Phd/YefM family antitoxin [Rubrobacteraceae bacterium]
MQEAKQRFSELIRRALEEGPQTVTKHGEEVVVVVPAKDYERLVAESGKDFKRFLMCAPDLDRLDIRRDKSSSRVVELGS